MYNIPCKGDVIYKGDGRMESYRRDAVLCGDPDAVVRPRDWQDVTDIVKWCTGNNAPLTVCGARTSMTGASVAESGVLLTTDRFCRMIDIGVKDGKGFAVVEPGMIARDLQKLVEESGFSYPVVPTSCDNAFIGGMVSTNATGEDFYKYGPTRSFVESITIIRMDGTIETFSRKGPAPAPEKGRGGYFMSGDDIDLIIGSEGTLGIIKEIRLSLLTDVPKVFAILVPFPSCISALAFIDETNRNGYSPRSIEYIDTFALRLMKAHKACPGFPDNTKACLYIKDETFGSPIEPVIDKWYGLLSKALKEHPYMLEHAIIGISEKEKEKIHQLRHQIPQALSETKDEAEKEGGGKVSGDWWIPKKDMLNALCRVYDDVLPLGIDFTMYGHVGDGHPHTTFICRNASEKAAAERTVLAQAKRAVALGGGVAGEHGIGKIKHELMKIQYDVTTLEKMRKIKERFDPLWVLGRGNILEK